MSDEDRWAKLEEIVRRVVREELSTAFQQKPKSKVRFEGGKFVGLGDIERAALAAAYPAVDIAQELREAAAWILLNPTTAPKSNYGAFINTWLKKHQDRSAIRAIPTRSDGEKKKLCAYCDKPSTAKPNGTPACDEHFMAAMHHEPIPFMRGVVAKNVTGER
ncbi:MAG TPA: hypothetical protein VFU31_24855 [Candidatus Binatia bacterium]|nr:hypothetical protein [Candidatus Binatia bacterium]